MTMRFKDKKVILSDTVSVEDAEALLAWLQGKKNARVVLADCTHLHPANLQVLMAAGVQVNAWPADSALALWLQTALSPTPTSSD